MRDAPSIAVVTLQYGKLAINSPNPSGNVAEVQIDPLSGNVEVTLNGASEEFAAASVMSITYKGGSGGGDTFTNDTGLTSLDYGHGGGNTFTGGSGYDFVYFFATTILSTSIFQPTPLTPSLILQISRTKRDRQDTPPRDRSRSTIWTGSDRPA